MVLKINTANYSGVRVAEKGQMICLGSWFFNLGASSMVRSVCEKSYSGSVFFSEYYTSIKFFFLRLKSFVTVILVNDQKSIFTDFEVKKVL